MAVDIQRVVLAALEAALRDDKPEEKSKRLSAGKAVAVGAVLVTAGRVAAKPGGRFVKEKLRERLSDDSESDEDDASHEDAAYDEAEAEFDERQQPEAEADENPEAEEDQEPQAEEYQEPEAEAQEPQADEDKRAAAETSEEDESDADEYPDGGPGPDATGPAYGAEAPDEPGAEGDEDVEYESDARPLKTRPRPPIFDRPGASGSKIRPAARPPLAKKKRPSALKNGSKPGRTRRARTPVDRT